MKKALVVISCLFIIYGFMGCASSKHAAQVNKNSGVLVLPPYRGSKACIAVADFDVKSAKATGEIGIGLREMLITAMVNSNRFSVLERQQLGAVMQEQELSALGAAQQGTDAQRGKVKAADIIVSAAVTEFEPASSGGAAGIGGGGGVASGVLGGLLGAAMNKSHMAIDLRIVDTSTSESLASTRVQGQASDVTGRSMTGSMGNWALGAGLGAYANTPMEKAIRICIIEAVRYIAQAIPANYYRY